MEKVKLEKNRVFPAFVNGYPKYFTHGKGRFLAAAKWEQKGFSIFSFGEDISIKYKEDNDLFKALGLLMLEMEKGNKGIIKIRRV